MDDALIETVLAALALDHSKNFLVWRIVVFAESVDWMDLGNSSPLAVRRADITTTFLMLGAERKNTSNFGDLWMFICPRLETGRFLSA